MANDNQNELPELRRRLREAEARIESLRSSENESRERQQALEQENLQLRKENAELSRSLPIETAILSDEDNAQLNPVSLTFLGRDKSMFALVRRHFPHAAQFVGPTSSGFKRQQPPEVLVCRLDKNEAGRRQLMKFIRDRHSKTAFLFYGPGARDFLRNNRKQLIGAIAEVLLEDISETALLNRLNAIVELRKAVCSVEDPNSPLIGRSQKFIDVVTQLLRLTRFSDPVLIKSEDPGEALAAAQEIYNRSGRRGKVVHLRVDTLDLESDPTLLMPADEQTIKRLFERARNGVLVADNIGLMSDEQLAKFLILAHEAEQVRLVCILNPALNNRLVEIPGELESLMLEIPSIARRDEDIPLFVHYFTLLHNLQVEREVYLSQAEVNQLINNGVKSIARLKSYVFEMLGEKFSTTSTPGFSWERKTKTLEEYLAEFEARILAETLSQCEGNKSKAARLLGLRPNTLHYKLSRLGIDAEKRKKRKTAVDQEN
jgi:DNA-binding NtrC family response regulator